jgi:hypothetical protein
MRSVFVQKVVDFSIYWPLEPQPTKKKQEKKSTTHICMHYYTGEYFQLGGVCIGGDMRSVRTLDASGLCVIDSMSFEPITLAG